MLRRAPPENSVRSDEPPCYEHPSQILILGMTLWLGLLPIQNDSVLAIDGTTGVPRQQPKHASPYVGSAMAVLAALQQAAVLPPEGTREADRVIQAVIQLQSVFAKGADPAIQAFAQRALADRHGEQAAPALEQFRANGWTADVLEALADADFKASPDEGEKLAVGLGQFNVSVDDFRRFMRLVRDGRSALMAQGLAFEEVYTRHRNTMPGATR